MSSNTPSDDPIRSITDKIRNWFNRTPQAQRAYERISTDLDTVVAKAESFVEENDTLRDLRGKIGAAIDPPAARPGDPIDAPTTPPATDAAPAPLSGTSAAPPPPLSGESAAPPPATGGLPTSSTLPTVTTPPPPEGLPTSSTLPTPNTAEPPASSPPDPTGGTIESRRLPG